MYQILVDGVPCGSCGKLEKMTAQLDLLERYAREHEFSYCRVSLFWLVVLNTVYTIETA